MSTVSPMYHDTVGENDIDKTNCKKPRHSMNDGEEQTAQFTTEPSQSTFPFEFSAEECLKTKPTLLTVTNAEAKKQEIREYFHKTFTVYERLFDVLVSDETFYMQPETLRHPLVFYFGHTAVFYINKLRVAGFLSDRIDAHIESTCAIGVDEMSWDDLNPKHYNWPTIARLREYRNQCRSLVDKLIVDSPINGSTIGWDSVFWVILMGIEHERIHLETSSVLFRQLPINQVRKVDLFAACPHDDTPQDMMAINAHITEQKNQQLIAANKHIVDGADVTVESVMSYINPEPSSPTSTTAPSLAHTPSSHSSSDWSLSPSLLEVSRSAPLPVMKTVPAATITLGKPSSHALYGWDNEYGVLPVTVQSFKAATTLVSNAQFLAFMAAGGYTTERYWTTEGWNFAQFKVNDRNMPHPVFWVPVRDDAGNLVTYKYRSMSEERDMPWSWPVDINCLEGKAYANWLKEATGRSMRMPSEAEWIRLREHCVSVYGDGDLTRNDLPYWTQAPGNINLEHYASSCPTTMFNYLGSGFYDVIGNVWQHCETPMFPYPGFKVHPVYDDFTVPTYDNMHAMIKGGSWVSTGNEATAHARYAFRRHFYQHAGVRVVESDIVLDDLERAKERVSTDVAINNLVNDHYYDIDNNTAVKRRVGGDVPYPVTIANTLVNITRKHNITLDTVLYQGCSVGRGVFELAHHANKVTGYDFTTREIETGVQLQSDCLYAYTLPIEGTISSYHKLDLTGSKPACAHIHTVRDKVEFVQGDICNFADDKFTQYQLVVSQGLESVYSPKKAINSLKTHVAVGGLMVVLMTGDWNAKTPESEYIGGYKDCTTGENVSLGDGLAVLMEGFQAVDIDAQDQEVVAHFRKNARVYNTQLYQLFAFKKL